MTTFGPRLSVHEQDIVRPCGDAGDGRRDRGGGAARHFEVESSRVGVPTVAEVGLTASRATLPTGKLGCQDAGVFVAVFPLQMIGAARTSGERYRDCPRQRGRYCESDQVHVPSPLEIRCGRPPSVIDNGTTTPLFYSWGEPRHHSVYPAGVGRSPPPRPRLQVTPTGHPRLVSPGPPGGNPPRFETQRDGELLSFETQACTTLSPPSAVRAMPFIHHFATLIGRPESS